MHIASNPFLDLYFRHSSFAYSSSFDNDNNKQFIDWMDKKALQPLKDFAKCPYCPINPQNSYYMTVHIETMHSQEKDYKEQLTQSELLDDNKKNKKKRSHLTMND